MLEGPPPPERSVIRSSPLLALAGGAWLLLAPEAAAESVRYFREADLGVHPARPRAEISHVAAEQMEASGRGPYYIATFDDEGRIRSLERRQRGEQSFRYFYDYPASVSAGADPVVLPGQP
jgi:hypothetical protein